MQVHPVHAADESSTEAAQFLWKLMATQEWTLPATPRRFHQTDIKVDSARRCPPPVVTCSNASRHFHRVEKR